VKIKVQVKPNSKTQHISLSKDGTYTVSLKSLPIDGRANIELIDILSKYFNVSKSSVIVKRGKNSRIKFIEVLEA